MMAESLGNLLVYSEDINNDQIGNVSVHGIHKDVFIESLYDEFLELVNDMDHTVKIKSIEAIGKLALHNFFDEKHMRDDLIP
jgi:hypothetical protein